MSLMGPRAQGPMGPWAQGSGGHKGPWSTRTKRGVLKGGYFWVEGGRGGHPRSPKGTHGVKGDVQGISWKWNNVFQLQEGNSLYLDTITKPFPNLCGQRHFCWRNFSLARKILFSLERRLSFVRITKSCRRHHLYLSNSLSSEEESGRGVFTA